MRKQITTNIYPSVAKMEMSAISDYPGVNKCSHVIISNGKIVQSCSGGYGLIKNEDFFGAFEQKLKEEHIKFTATYRNVNDSQFAADYIFDGEMKVATSKDIVQPKARLINTYDGTGRTAGFLGDYRQVCTNGLHAFQFNIAFNIRHTSKAMELTMPNLTEMLETYKKKDGVNIYRRYEVLAEQKVTDLNDYVKAIANGLELFKFEKSEKNESPSINADYVIDVTKRESAILNVTPNKWIVYNAFNNWLNNDERNGKTDSQRVAIDSKLFEYIENH